MAQLLVADPTPSFARELSALLSRFGDQVQWVASGADAVSWMTGGEVDLVLLDEQLDGGRPFLALNSGVIRGPRPPVILLTSPRGLDGLIEAAHQGCVRSIIKPYHAREVVLVIHAMLRAHRRIVCLGGGTGLYTLLLGLKRLPGVHVTSVVGMSDDGGSSGRIREAFGVLPPGDVRRSLVALSSAPALMNDVLQYRFQGAKELAGHPMGNLLLTAVAHVTGSMAEAVRAISDLLNVQGVVLPVTTTLNTLVAEFEDGTVVKGEHAIDVPEGRDPRLKIRRIWQEPEADANPDALAAILGADVITIGPGDLFTSVLATLSVKEVSRAVRASRARTVVVANLMTKPGETSGFTVADHLREIVRYLGEDALDDVLVSNTPLSRDAVAQYARKDQEPVRLDEPETIAAVTRAALTARDIGSEEELVRHHSAKLASAMAALLGLNPSDSPL
ncbi:MAG TPA: uridine diphosphate-N-acetylglucosamine-binding protein YvcK [bacterium]